MRSSFFRVRSCVSSSEPLSVSTFVLTLPTSVRTNFFDAHAGATATDSASTPTAYSLFAMMPISSVDGQPTTQLLFATTSQRPRHVPTSRVHSQVPFPSPDFDRVPSRADTRFEGDEVLKTQLSQDVADGLDSVAGHARVAQVAAGPPCEVGQPALLRGLRVRRTRLEFTIRMIGRVDHGQEIHRHVDRARHARHLRRRQLAPRVNTVGNHE